MLDRMNYVNYGVRPITLEVYANNLLFVDDRINVSKNLAIACEIMNRSRISDAPLVENRGLKCIGFENFQGIVLVVNGKYACQELEGFNLMDRNPWISKACTAYAQKIFEQLKSIEELAYLRPLQLKDDGNFIQVEILNGTVVTIEESKYLKHRDVFAEVFKNKHFSKKLGGAFLNKFLVGGKKF
jgi:hypothetical protein